MKKEISPCTQGDAEYIAETLRESNNALIPSVTEEDYILLKAVDGKTLLGGCIVLIDRWGVADLDILWVDENYRRQGIGSALISEAERMARGKGCSAITLGTFDFQARELYEKHGFTLCGKMENCPKGHEHYDMIKYLDTPFQKYNPCVVCTYPIVPADGEEAEMIEDALSRYNHSQVPYAHDFESFERKITDADGKLLAGCLAGLIGWNNAFLDAVLVEEAYRGQKIGSELLGEIERELQQKGAFMVIAEAFDKQAEFFLKNGYSVYGKFENCPKGHCRYKLEKRF